MKKIPVCTRGGEMTGFASSNIYTVNINIINEFLLGPLSKSKLVLITLIRLIYPTYCALIINL